jgi:hypothetical protein
MIPAMGRPADIGARLLLLGAFACADAGSAWAVEGTTAAGPIGGTDIRVALAPPPGLYGAAVLLGARAWGINDGAGNPIPEFDAARFGKVIGGGAFLYVPDVQVGGGSIGLFGVVPFGQICGRLLAVQSWACVRGVGDPYFELSWSRYFGTPRRSSDPSAFPIPEGLAISFGLGAVIPVGQYDMRLATTQALSVGNNTFDIAPSVAFTYTTPALIAEGTEISAKLFLNNYETNPDTRYHAGTLLNLDFAVTERFGRFQAGFAGFYTFQIADDRLNDVRIPPDGRRVELLMLGGVINYDMPELGAVMKFKALESVIAKNTVNNNGGVISVVKKLY